MRSRAWFVGAVLVLCAFGGSAAAEEPAARFDGEGRLLRPDGWREWVYVGTPLTPNDLNGGKAPFPEFHAVDLDRGSRDHFRKTGSFREGTILVKELVSVGSTQAVSARATSWASSSASRRR